MAYAEKPHRELGLAATQLGLAEEAEAQVAKANAAGVVAGRAFVADKQSRVDAMRAQVEAGALAESSETETSFEVWLGATKKALVERYSTKERTLTEDDFSLFSYETEDGKTVRTVSFNGINGLDLGDPAENYDPKRSYNAVMIDDTHIITIDGTEYDTRKGSTWGTYQARVAEAETNGRPLPDASTKGSLDNGTQTITLLTGEEAVDVDARYGYVHDGRADFRWVFRVYASRSVRFAPAVVVPEELVA